MKKFLTVILTLAMVSSLLCGMTVFAEDDTESTEPVVETIVVPVTISGEYQGVNHWANATYSFVVTDGVAADNGWISNGNYKFMYYPATGQIKNTAQATSFALEDGKGIPEYIVIPYTIGAFSTDYATYDAKTIVLYAQSANYAIFRYNSSANTTIVIPEGVTTIPSNVFGQNDKNNSNQHFILPSTLTTISSNAFAQSSGGGIYKNFDIPNGVTRIDGGAFSNCRNTDYVIPSGVTTLNAIFTFNRNLKNVTFKGNIPNIPNNCFRQCYALTSLTFEGNAAAPTVGDSAFNGVTSLADFTVYYPATATGFTDETFQAKFPAGTKFVAVGGYVGGHISDVTTDGVDTTVTYSAVDTNNNASVVVLVALYNGDVMIGAKTVSMDENTVTFTGVTGADKTMLFIWDSLSSATPLYNAAEY